MQEGLPNTSRYPHRLGITVSEDKDFVLTEAEKDALSRKRERSPPPASQVEEVSDLMEEEGSSEEEQAPPGSRPHVRRQLFASSSGVDEDEAQAEGEQALLMLASHTPDLRVYFSQWPYMDAKQIISMCRAYASYLATLSRKDPPKKRSRGTK